MNSMTTATATAELNRHDILILFEVSNGNPNGDPDSGNQPRIDPATARGLVSDVCLKRKVRNFVQMFPPDREEGGNGFNIFIQQGAVLNREQETAIQATATPDKDDRRGHAERTKDWLCREFFDVRAFGAVISTGGEVMKGSAFGQIRGPVQFSFGQSLDPINPIEVTITRCAVTKEEDVKKERTMGQKYIVPYALYAAKCYVSPAFARNTGFDASDFDVLVEALTHLFDHDRSASRGDMVVRGVYDFEHIGTQGSGANPAQNRREAMLGCAHAHDLFEAVKIAKDDADAIPQGFADYTVRCDGFGPDGRSARFPGVILHRRVSPERGA
jgi:CRISPR-associated protein Csd2